jgi:hypothetical protein
VSQGVDFDLQFDATRKGVQQVQHDADAQEQVSVRVGDDVECRNAL